jgi:hypothetical protein
MMMMMLHELEMHPNVDLLNHLLDVMVDYQMDCYLLWHYLSVNLLVLTGLK